MAAPLLSPKPLEEMVRNLKVDPSSTKLPNYNKVPLKERSASDATSCISSVGDVPGSVKESDVDHESVATDGGSTYSFGTYYGYYYPGYDGSLGEVDDQGCYVSGDGTELQYPVMQADNGSFVYVMPAFQPNYNPYGSYLPVTTFGVDGHYLGQQPYSPSPMFQPSLGSPGYYPNTLPYGELVPSPYAWDPSVFVGDATYTYGYSGVPDSKFNVSSASHARTPFSKKVANSNFNNHSEIKSSLPSLDVSSGHGSRNQLKSTSKASQHGSNFQSDVLGRGYFPFGKFPMYNQGKGGVLYPNNPVNCKADTRGYVGTEKLKSRSKVNNVSDFSLLSEQNHGPRTTNPKGAPMSGGNPAGPLDIDGKGNGNSITSLIRRDEYNLPDFPTKYDCAFFFIIKSYSEDDIHKSIKYNVWASTPNGNKRLDSAYEDAQHRITEKGSKCPVFLFFSVNASGQFCGVAEMTGRVNFDKSMDFWQQDKWNGYFPVKWHIIKDVPNPQLRHIILENNENKPVTNSRDTQEVRLPQGIEMLNIFKNYASKTSILDDFDFYENRQKVMEEKKIKSSVPHIYLQQKADELATGLQSIDLSPGKNVEEPRKG